MRKIENELKLDGFFRLKLLHRFSELKMKKTFRSIKREEEKTRIKCFTLPFHLKWTFEYKKSIFCINLHLSCVFISFEWALKERKKQRKHYMEIHF